MRFKLKKKGVTRVIVFPDTQFPHIDKKALSAVNKYLLDKDTPKFDLWLQLGDLMDFGYCSRWTKGNYRFLEGKRFMKDYEAANEWLDDLQGTLKKNNRSMKFVVLEGNHDKRPEDVIDMNPALEGLIEIEVGLDFEARNIQYIKNWNSKEPYIIGNANFIHGDKINSHHAKGMSHDWDVPIFYGHTHDINCHSRVTRSKEKVVVAQSLGCLCRFDMDYVGKKPTNWQQAVTIFNFLPNGNFQYDILRIINGTLITQDGRVFTGD